MRTLYRLTRVAFTVVLILMIAGDLMLALELFGHLFSGGLRSVNAWIMHMGTGGRINIAQAGPDSVQLEFPSKATIYGRFAGSCVLLLLGTVGSWWSRRLSKRKAMTPLEP
jgi:hypothetical protein